MTKTTKSEKLVKVYWIDPVAYKYDGKKFPRPVKMLTVGSIAKETEDYLVVKDPLSYSYEDGHSNVVPRYLNEDITFFSIPKNLISMTRNVDDKK